MQGLKGHDGMNDFFLEILIRQRQAEILAEVRAAQLSRLGRFLVTLGNRSLRIFHSFCSKCKDPMAFEPPGAVGRKIL